MSNELVMYSRKLGCPMVTLAKHVLEEYGIAYREIFVDQQAARNQVISWTGFVSVPTLIVARPGEDLPLETPAHLERGASPRGIDRGAMITEPNREQLTQWLRKHGFIGTDNL